VTIRPGYFDRQEGINTPNNELPAMNSKLLIFANYDTRKITGYAVPHCRGKEVSLTSGTDNKR
jgi:hypothetical protein